MQPMLNIALRAARSAGELIFRSIERLDAVAANEKEAKDYVSEIDLAAEQCIINLLRKSYPNHGFKGEETGEIAGKGEGADYQWIIDPLDGTTNFLHGFPQFAVSIALRHRGTLEQGVVYDPLREELFTATRGVGAQLNGRRLRVSNRRGLEGALLGTGFPFKHHEHIDAYLGMFKTLMMATAGIRRPGSAALDLAYVAAGRLDGFWEIGLSPWDMAAGVLLIQEAGGTVGDLEGGPYYLESGNVVAGNLKIFPALLEAIRPHLNDALRARRFGRPR